MALYVCDCCFFHPYKWRYGTLLNRTLIAALQGTILLQHMQSSTMADEPIPIVMQLPRSEIRVLRMLSIWETQWLS